MVVDAVVVLTTAFEGMIDSGFKRGGCLLIAMTTPEQTMTRYLLGEISEQERIALEASYFNDSRLFDQLQRAENDLLDDYVRGRLPSPLTQRIERRYLTSPELRERLKFAEALVTRVDAIESFQPSAAAREAPRAGFLDRWRERAPAFGFSVAVVAGLVFAVGIWFFVSTTSRLRRELSEAQASRKYYEQQERDLQQQLADEQARADRLSSELSSLQTAQTTGASKSSEPLIASLMLAIGDVRGTEGGPSPKLVMTPQTEQARFQVELKDDDYPTYTVVLQSASGDQVFSRSGLLTKSKAHPRLVMMIPSKRLPEGDYLLVIKGVTKSGEAEDVSKSRFSVERK